AGADRGLLVLRHGEIEYVEAEAVSRDGKIQVVACQQSIASAAVPEGMLRHVLRTHEKVILDDAATSNLYSEDEYLATAHPGATSSVYRSGDHSMAREGGAPVRPRSILCMPLLKQGRLTGLLYLENSLTSHAFTSERTAVIELLAGQAAIALENA